MPTWLSIGISGAVLLAVGITWESRMNDVRRASRYVAAPALTPISGHGDSSGCTNCRAEWMRDFTVPTGMSSRAAMSA